MMHNKKEKEYLDLVYKNILKQLKDIDDSLKFTKDEIKTQNKDMWETVSNAPNNLNEMDGLVQAKVFLDSIKRSHRVKSSKEKRQKTLKRMKESAYFGRIDFRVENEEVEKIYIGISNLSDKKTYDILVYDWRAPICSIFYDQDIGEASYEAPDGRISGELLLRRQFKIKEDEILYMFDSRLKIDDEILMETLSNNADDKMKTIVMTIQKTQNRIIRDDEDEVIISMGPAGSGKTSIALHRIAYLMYRYKEDLKPEEIFILSPNNIFSGYIDNVLPQLGEEKVLEKTLVEILEKYLPDEFSLQTFTQYMEAILEKKDDERIENIKIKSSGKFLEKLDQYIIRIENEVIEFQDIIYNNKVIISKKTMHSMYIEDKKYFNPVQRLERIKLRIENAIKPIKNSEYKKEYESILESDEYFSKGAAKREAKRVIDVKFKDIDEFISKLTSIDLASLYLKFIKKEFKNVFDITKQQILKKYLLYEDISPYSYFMIRLGRLNSKGNIKQIVIDEVQDYSPLSLKLIYMLFPEARFTLLGDENQLVNKGITEFEAYDLKKIFSDKKIVSINMNKSYRSTIEIFEFCKKIIKPILKTEISGVLRHGKKPKIKKSSNLCADISKNIDEFIKEGYETIAVITKTSSQATKLYDKIKCKHKRINLIDNEDILFKKGITVISSYLAKGLEVDCVIIENANEGNYSDLGDRKILYTIASRALHRLSIYYEGEISKFIDF